jgi:phage major head subunit gpT-like protein
LEYFDASHVEGSSYTTVQSNLDSKVLNATNLSLAKTAMRQFKDDRGKPMNIIADTLVVPPDLEPDAQKLLYSTTLDASGNVNVHKNSFKLIVTPWITDAENWYLLCTNRVTKPLIFQDREATTFEALEGNSENGFMRNEYLYGVKNRFNIGYGDWRMAYANTP